MGFELEGAFDLRALNEWLGQLLQERGNDIFRSKGILSVAGTDDKCAAPPRISHSALLQQCICEQFSS